MGTHHRRVDHEPLAVGEAIPQACQNVVPQTFPAPATKARIDTLPRPKEVRYIWPGTARAQNPEHGLHHHTVVLGRTTPPQILCITGLEPMRVNFFRTTQTGSVNTSLSCCMTITCNQNPEPYPSLFITKVQF